MHSMSFDPAVANIGSQVVDDAIQGLQAGVTVSTSVTDLAPAGADEVSAQAALRFAAAGAQMLTLNTAAQEELMRTGAAFSEIARRYAETDAALAGRLGDVLSLSGWRDRDMHQPGTNPSRRGWRTSFKLHPRERDTKWVPDRNVLGGPLEPCGTDPLTGYYRDGCCSTGPEDLGRHTICAVMTAEFLEHQRSIGNDLLTPVPEYRFPGLLPGDRWCVTALNWLRAHNDGCAAPVVLASTHERTLEVVPIEALLEHKVDVPDDLANL